MKMKVEPLLEAIRANFWFVPTVMIILTLFMAIFTIWIDASGFASVDTLFPILYSSDVEAIRSLLGTIAAAMITVTSIAFSITIVALTLASSQFGPRLMRNFMKDRTTQIVLGVFISTFLYCIFIFCAISLEAPYQFTPGMSVLWAISMTCVCIGFLIHFIHHVSISIQADSVIEDVYCELKHSIEKLFPNNISDSNEMLSSEGNVGEGEYSFHEQLRCEQSGYVQLIDLPALIAELVSLDMQVELHFSPGDYVVKGDVFGDLYASKAIDEEHKNGLAKHFMLGSQRTPVQDPEFAVGQLVEIAVRALSPGINDPFTAITCVDKLSSAMSNLCAKHFPNVMWKDEQQVIRVECKSITFSAIANAAFDQIRQHAFNDTAVTIRLLEALKSIALRANKDEHYHFVFQQTDMIEERQSSRKVSSLDALAIKQRIQAVRSYLEQSSAA